MRGRELKRQSGDLETADEVRSEQSTYPTQKLRGGLPCALAADEAALPCTTGDLPTCAPHNAQGTIPLDLGSSMPEVAARRQNTARGDGNLSDYSESDLVIPALDLLARNPGGLTTTDLIEQLTEHLNPDGADAEILANRQDTHFSQKVRNLVSHRTLDQPGWATYDPRTSIHTITPAGRTHLDAHPSERLP